MWLFSEIGLTYAANAGLAVAHELPAYQAKPSVFFRDHILAINNVLVGLQEFGTRRQASPLRRSCMTTSSSATRSSWRSRARGSKRAPIG